MNEELKTYKLVLVGSINCSILFTVLLFVYQKVEESVTKEGKYLKKLDRLGLIWGFFIPRMARKTWQ